MRKFRSNTPEACAARLTKFIAKPARSAKTRAYIASLPKRPKIVVTAADYGDAKSRFAKARVIARGVLARLANGEGVTLPVDAARLPAGIRLRPSARPAAPSRWHCRPTGKRHSPGSAGKGRQMWLDSQAALLRGVVLALWQDMTCALCGKAMSQFAEKGGRISTDHVVPRFLGGKDEWGNFFAAHRQCNSDKANDHPTGCEQVFLLALNLRMGIAAAALRARSPNPLPKDQ